MVRQKLWNRRIAALLTASYLALGTGAAWAAEIELSLADSIALALQNNPAVKIAQSEREQAVWGVKEARGGKLPSVGLTHNSRRGDSDNRGVFNSFSNSIELSMPLYTGGNLEGQIERSKIGLQSADLTVEKTRQQLKLDATSGYFTILQTRNLLDVNRQSVDNLLEHLKNVQAQYAVGTVAKVDVLRSEVELANEQQNLIKAQNAYELAISNMNNIIGLPLESQLIIKDDLKYQQYLLSLEDSIGYALENRPDAKQAALAIANAQQSVRIAKSGQRPTLNATASTGWSDDTFPGDENHTWSVGIRASWNVFDSGVTKAKIKQADSSVDKAAAQSAQMLDSIQLEVRQAYLSLKEAEKRIETSHVAVDKAEEDFKIAQVRYSAGVGTNLDVIDTQVALAKAKTNYIQALYDYNTNKAELDKAMGKAADSDQL